MNAEVDQCALRQKARSTDADAANGGATTFLVERCAGSHEVLAVDIRLAVQPAHADRRQPSKRRTPTPFWPAQIQAYEAGR